MMLILAPIDDHNLYSNGHTVARPVTMSVVEHPRKRPITLPVVQVRVEVSPVLLVRTPSRSFVGWEVGLVSFSVGSQHFHHDCSQH